MAVVFEYPQAIGPQAIQIQADNNDTYIVESSEDSVTWTKVWRAPPVYFQEGLVTRQKVFEEPPAPAKFWRVRSGAGDGRFSVNYFELLTAVPDTSKTSSTLPHVHNIHGFFGLSGGALRRLQVTIAWVDFSSDCLVAGP